MTLVEILIAMGILALGFVGILTLFPLSIRNFQTATDRTTAATVVKNAIASLHRYQVGLGQDDTGTPELEGYFQLPLVYSAAFPPSIGWHQVPDPTAPAPTMPKVILMHHQSSPAHMVGNGARPLLQNPPREGATVRRTFRIPDDLANTPGEISDAANNVVVVPWKRQIGWTAVFLPIPEDDDGNWGADEDPLGDPDGDANHDDDNDGATDEDDCIMQGSRYRVQIAVWRGYALIHEGTDPFTGTFWGADEVDNDADTEVDEDDEDEGVTVQLDQPGTDVQKGDYIRHDAHGFWYEIAGLSSDNMTVTLKRPFNHPHPGSSFVAAEISIASQWKLIHTVETVVGGQ